jgi:hypothetical protein
MLFLRTLLLCSLAGTLVACAIGQATPPPTVSPRAANTPPEYAVEIALRVLRSGSPIFSFPNPPSEIRGQSMLLGPALTFITRGAPPSYSPSVEPERLVWVIVARGKGRSPSPPVPNATTTPDAVITQVAMILDAETGQVVLTTTFPPEDELDATSLPRLNFPPTPTSATGYP